MKKINMIIKALQTEIVKNLDILNSLTGPKKQVVSVHQRNYDTSHIISALSRMKATYSTQNSKV